MFDDGGLLQQYIEISIGPIMNAAIAQFEDEESWKVASQWLSISFQSMLCKLTLNRKVSSVLTFHKVSSEMEDSGLESWGYAQRKETSTKLCEIYPKFC